MTENNNPVVMTWFQQQQTPAGWFDLLIIMVEGMLNNAGELESQPFLRQMGASLAETHPLPASETVGELEANINRLLTRDDRQGCNADLLAQHRKLLLRSRAINVERRHQRLLAVFFPN